MLKLKEYLIHNIKEFKCECIGHRILRLDVDDFITHNVSKSVRTTIYCQRCGVPLWLKYDDRNKNKICIKEFTDYMLD